MPISLNILGLPVPDVPALLDWCAADKPPYIVVMDSPDIANRISMVAPSTKIIFRRYRPHDSRLHETISPTEFLDSVADLPALLAGRRLTG